MARELVRQETFFPYGFPTFPIFYLTIWDTNRTRNGKFVLGYRLGMRGNEGFVDLFQGEDFAASPLHAIDSNATVVALMNFLTLRPGDTDSEYFTDYNADQLHFAETHAKALSLHVEETLGE